VPHTRLINSRRFGWVGHVAQMRYKKCMWNCARKLEGYSSFGSHRHGGENSNETGSEMWRESVNWIHLIRIQNIGGWFL